MTLDGVVQFLDSPKYTVALIRQSLRKERGHTTDWGQGGVPECHGNIWSPFLSSAHKSIKFNPWFPKQEEKNKQTRDEGYAGHQRMPLGQVGDYNRAVASDFNVVLFIITWYI